MFKMKMVGYSRMISDKKQRIFILKGENTILVKKNVY